MIAFFAGCTTSVKQTTPNNSTDNLTNTGEKTDISKTMDQNDIKKENDNQDNVDGSEMYIGKHLLAGLTYRNSEGEVIKRFQLHGKITRITKSGIFFNRADGKGEFALPPDLESLEPVIPGAEYRLKSTDEVVRDADYISNWIIDLPPDKEDE